MKSWLLRTCLIIGIGISLNISITTAGDHETLRNNKSRGAAISQGGSEPSAKIFRVRKFAISTPLKNLPKVRHDSKIKDREIPNELLGRKPKTQGRPITSPAMPVLKDQIPAPIQNFDGMSVSDQPFLGAPPDTNGDVGPNQYVQVVNTSIKVYDKTGSPLAGPVSLGNLFGNLDFPCTENNGDPIVLYDHLADRWLISQFGVDFPSFNPPYFECIAISQTSDPSGAYFLYSFEMPNDNLPDYPHLGVWPDGYYMTTNQFLVSAGFAFEGTGAFAFDRAKMLNGDSTASMIYFDLSQISTIGPFVGGMLPADLDGPPPPEGTPNYFAVLTDDNFGDPQDGLRLFQFHADFNQPANSSFNELPPIATDSFNIEVCDGFDQNCIPQRNTADGLDALSDRLMHRLQYRNFGTNAKLVFSHTVDVDDRDHAGIHWGVVDIDNISGAATLQDDGIYAPDADHRWMCSAAMDASGNLAIGFSVSGPSMFPSIHYAGRLPTDPSGTLAQGENSVVAGTGSQVDTANRWGDYSMLSVDPADDCTFWVTNEYYKTMTPFDWSTRIASFGLGTAACATPASGTISGTVIDAVTSLPIAGASIRTSNGFFTATDAGGIYSLRVPPGDYQVIASAVGFVSSLPVATTVTAGIASNLDFVLSQCPVVLAPNVLPDGNLNAAYPPQTIVASGGTGPYSYVVFSGELPTGLSLEHATGVLSGTPTLGGTFRFTIAAIDSAGGCSGTQSYTITICSHFVKLSPGFLPDGQLGAAYSQTVSSEVLYLAAGNRLFGIDPTDASAFRAAVLSPLAAGSINALATEPGTGRIFGASGSRSSDLITIDPDSGGVTTIGNPGIGTIRALAFNNTGALYAINDTDSDCLLYLIDTTTAVPTLIGPIKDGTTPYVAITGMDFHPETGTLYAEGFRNDRFLYQLMTINTATAEATPVNFLWPSHSDFAFRSDGSLFTIAIPQFLFSHFTEGLGIIDLERNRFFPIGKTGVQSTGSIDNAVTFLRRNIALSLDAGTLPAGLSLDSATGRLSGTPNATGTFLFTLATNSTAGSCAEQEDFNINISGIGCAPINLLPSALPDASLHVSYSQTISASPAGGFFTVSDGALPPGLSLDPATGVLSGSPLALGVFDFKISYQVTVGGENCYGSSVYTLKAGVFQEEFDAPAPPANWTYAPNADSWAADGNDLIGNPIKGKTTAIATPAFPGCSQCAFEFNLRTSGKTSLLVWYQDSKNYFELIANEPGGRWIFRQRAFGRIVQKFSLRGPIRPTEDYTIRIQYDGAIIDAEILNSDLFDGVGFQTLPAALPNGTFAFRLKHATAHFDYVRVIPQ